jgi:hypothetical protein
VVDGSYHPSKDQLETQPTSSATTQQCNPKTRRRTALFSKTNRATYQHLPGSNNTANAHNRLPHPRSMRSTAKSSEAQRMEIFMEGYKPANFTGDEVYLDISLRHLQMDAQMD